MRQLVKLLSAFALALAPASAFAQAGAITTTGSLTIEACATPTITASSAYTTGNLVGGKLSLTPTFRSTGTGAPDSGGIVQSIRLNSKSVQTATFKAYQFSSNPSATTWTDKAAPSIAGADVFKVRPPISLTTADSGLGTMTSYGTDQIGRIHVASGSTDYWALVVVGTPTFTTASDLQFCVTYLVD